MALFIVIQDSGSHLRSHYSPTRAPGIAPPPYKPSAATSLHSHPTSTSSSPSASTLDLNLDLSALANCIQVSPITASSITTTPILNPTPNPVFDLPEDSILTSPPPVYTRNPSPPSPSNPLSPQKPPSYTPQEVLPLAFSRTSTFSALYGMSEYPEERCEGWCFPSFWKTMPSDEHLRGGTGRLEWNDSGMVSGNGEDNWRDWNSQHAYYIF
jgi:hypothetical protein